MHGYELRKQLGAMLGPFWQVSWGSLYPTLRRLARAGAVEKDTEATPARSRRSKTRGARTKGTGSLTSGRRKTVYRITPRGEGMFAEMLEETAAVDAERFTLNLAFFRYLQPDLGGRHVYLRGYGYCELLVVARRNLFWGDDDVGIGHAGHGERQNHAQ